VHMNFGPEFHDPLPFKCRLLNDASKEDVDVSPYQKPKDGKYEVMLPMFLPEQGTFDWVDWFMSQNPHWTEISDRKIIEWAVRSGFWRPKGQSGKASFDKPDMNLGVSQLDDGSVRFLITMAAALQERNILIMEVRGNALATERADTLKPFRFPHWRRVCQVMIGAPSGPYLEQIHDRMLKEKQEKLSLEFKAEAQEKIRKRLIATRTKKMDIEKKRAEKKRLREEEEARRAEEALAKGIEAEPMPEEEEEEDEPMEEAEEEKAGEEEKEEEPKATLTKVEEQDYFKRKEATIPDVTSAILGNCFSTFAVPASTESFDDVRYPWRPKEEVEELIRQWRVERRMTNRIEGVQPSEWFKEKWTQWQKDLQTWMGKHNEYKDPVKRAERIAAKEKADAAKAKEEKKAEVKDEVKEEEVKKEEVKEEGEQKDVEMKTEEEDEEAKKKRKEAEKKKAEEEAVLDADPFKVLAEELEQNDLDVFGVEDVLDVGGTGEPLFASFSFEDWALLSLRFELHLLCHAFKRDCNDPERVGFPAEHLQFYFNRYYKKTLNPKQYGVEKVEELVKTVGDTTLIVNRVIESQLSADLEANSIFLMLTEEARRERQERLDAGDESARLKFTRTEPQMMGMGMGVNAPMQAKSQMAGGMQFPMGKGMFPSAPKSQMAGGLGAGGGMAGKGMMPPQNWSGGGNAWGMGKPGMFMGKGGYGGGFQKGGWGGKGMMGKAAWGPYSR